VLSHPISRMLLNEILNSATRSSRILIISKSTCPLCKVAKNLFNRCLNYPADVVDIDLAYESTQMTAIQDEMQSTIGARTVPQIFIENEHLGDSSRILFRYNIGELHQILDLPEPKYDYKFAVIGGGSGGVAAAKTASTLLGDPDKKQVIIFDYVSPTPNLLHTKWGIGGTCVNVGCIPKKLMHRAALVGDRLKDSAIYQSDSKPTHDWDTLRDDVNSYIKMLNFQTIADFSKRKNIEYINKHAKITAPNEITYTDSSGNTKKVTAEHILIATGTRPYIPSNLEHLKEHVITSDDLFYCPYSFGDTLVIGGGYVALECAGFLGSIGFDVTVAVRDIALRGFDRDCADRVVDAVNKHAKVCTKTQIKSIKLLRPADIENLKAGLFEVEFINANDKSGNPSTFRKQFNTVLVATGRYAITGDLVCDETNVPIEKDPKSLKLKCIREMTTFPNIYAVGDILHNRPELTPVAIAAGKKLASRLFDPTQSQNQMDWNKISTTVFTADEFASVGYSECDAHAEFVVKNGQEIEIFVSEEGQNSDLPSHIKYAKAISIKETGEVVGFHIIGEEVGEIITSFSMMMHKGLTIDSLLAHPELIWSRKYTLSGDKEESEQSVKSFKEDISIKERVFLF